MTLTLATFLMNVFGLNFENAQVWAKRLFIIIPLIGVLIVFIGVNRFCSSRNDRKLEKLNESIIEKKAEANVVANIIVGAEKERTNAEVNTNIAIFDFNHSSNRDSSEWSSLDRRIIDDRFCQQWPNDSTCQEWRERTGYNSSTSR